MSSTKKVSRRVRGKRRFLRTPLHLELLEDRCVPAVIFDSNTGFNVIPIVAGVHNGSPDTFVAENFRPTQDATLTSATLTLANLTGSAGQGSLQLFADARQLARPITAAQFSRDVISRRIVSRGDAR